MAAPEPVWIFCEGHLLMEAGGQKPAGAVALAELSPTVAVEARHRLKAPLAAEAVLLKGPPGPPPAGHEWVRLRALVAVHSPEAPAALRALGLLNWRLQHRFCGRCGGALREEPVETALHCAGCGQMEYPAMTPAVIVRVEKEGKILLARHVQRIPDIYTCLAGYLEVGESLEEGVRREVREEAGLEVTQIRYVASQPWPFPNQLMMGFCAQWAGGELRPQPEEISELGWFDPAALPRIPPPGTMAHRLICGS